MTSRSADRAAVVAVLVLGLLTVLVPGAAADSSDPAAPAGVRAPVLAISTPVEDIEVTVASLDGSRATVDLRRTRRLVIASSVLFAESSPVLSATARRALGEVAREVRASGASGTVTVNGYTDDQGSAAIGLVLSRRRSAAVTAVLSRDLSGLGLVFLQHGFGEAHPIAPNEQPDGSPDRAGQARNRRVEIVLHPARP